MTSLWRVSDKGTDLLLADELGVAGPAATQCLPKSGFRFGLIATKPTTPVC